MKYSWLLLAACWFLLGQHGRAEDVPILPRYQALDKGMGAKLRRVFGAGEMPTQFTRVSAIAEDGKTAAYVDFVPVAGDKVPDSRLLIWDISAGRFRKEIVVPGQATALALAGDGSSILVGTVAEEGKKDVHVVSQWDTATGKRLRTLGKHKNLISTLTFSRQGDQALSVCWSEIKTWNLTKGSEVRSFAWDDKVDIFTAAFLPDGKKILCVVNHTLRVIDLNEADAKKAAAGLLDLTGHQDTILGVAVSADGALAVSASRDDTIRSWDLAKGKPLHVLKKNVPANRTWISLGLGDDGKTVFSCWSDSNSDSGSAILSLWDAANGNEHWSRTGSYRGTVPIRVRGQAALIGGGCNVLTQWDLAKGTIQRAWGGQKSPVNAVRVDAQGRFYSAGQDGYVNIWEKEQISRAIAAHAEPILALALNPKETQLYTASADKTVKVWDIATGKLQRTLAGHTATVTSIAVGRDGKRVYTGSSDRTVIVWDAETGKLLTTLAGHADGVNAVVLTNDEAWVASASDDATIRFWPLQNGKLDPGREGSVLEQHKKAVTCLAFSLDGKTLFSGSQDQTMKVWDWSKGKLIRTIPGHKNWITSLLVADDGSVLTTSDDLTNCRWDIATGKEIGRIDFGAIGDCPRCLAKQGPNRTLVGTSSWMLFEFEWAAR